MNNTKNVKKEQDGGAKRIPRQARALGVRESLEHVGEKNEMPGLFTLTSTVGALATNVRVMIHKRAQPLSQIVLIIGDAGSKKSTMDEVYNEWAYELILEKWKIVQEEKAWRIEAKRDRNAKKQKDKPTFPMRIQTLNVTPAMLAERLEEAQGKHSLSFTPEIDTVLTKWGRNGVNEFSTMLRLSYDGSSYEREAKSLDAANVHIRSLLWNCILCGQPKSLYKLMTDMTNGLLSRAAIAKMHDNTYDMFDMDSPFTEQEKDKIHQVAHLLGLMQGTIILPRLEARSIKWANNICTLAAKDGNDVLARCRMRDHVTAYRMTVCLMLCKVAERLIKEHGYEGAEKALLDDPNLTANAIAKEETKAMMDTYDIIANYILDMDMLFFGEKLKSDYDNKDCRVMYEGRTYRTANDTIYECLPGTFSREQLVQQCKMNNGEEPTETKVQSMLRNWKRQGLIIKSENSFIKK